MLFSESILSIQLLYIFTTEMMNEIAVGFFNLIKHKAFLQKDCNWMYKILGFTIESFIERRVYLFLHVRNSR